MDLKELMLPVSTNELSFLFVESISKKKIFIYSFIILGINCSLFVFSFFVISIINERMVKIKMNCFLQSIKKNHHERNSKKKKKKKKKTKKNKSPRVNLSFCRVFRQKSPPLLFLSVFSNHVLPADIFLLLSCCPRRLNTIGRV